jgi:F-type H+-transporting ATPase subunit delta
LARRYATALFSAALEEGVVEQVRREIDDFRELLSRDDSLLRYLLSPQVLTEDKIALVRRVFGGRITRLFEDFLVFLIEKKRVEYTEDILDAYVKLYEQHAGIVTVRAITAVPLSERLERKLLEKLTAQTGKTIRLVKEVDPEIIGGMVILYEGKIVDGSVRFHLERLRRNLKEVKVQ